MARPPLHNLHPGEISVQRRMNAPRELARDLPRYIAPDMPQQHAEFFSGLAYLPLGALDTSGRPWASVVVTKSDDDTAIGIRISPDGELHVTGLTSPDDPLLRALTQSRKAAASKAPLFAGVGVDFTNRRRNKLAGTIANATSDASGKLHLTLQSDQHLGNCPKYITVRSLIPKARKAQTQLDQFKALHEPLSENCKQHINRASTVFLATKHMPKRDGPEDDQADMGFNHRGGAPGFVRLYEETIDNRVTTYLVLPDYSGNRFYQSLGNIQSDKLVGLALPDFASGDMLFVTGSAENLFDEDADELMPRMGLVTRIQVTGAVYIKQALDLKLASDEQHSPYNPPRRYLRRELAQMGHPSYPSGLSRSESPVTATLIDARMRTDNVTTFSFALSTQIDAPVPGGFGVFDFSGVLNHGYRHMSEENPQTVNEDYIRTWTLSSAPVFDPNRLIFSPTDTIEITVKREPGGLISNFLHEQAGAPRAAPKHKPLALTLKGVGGEFSCFTQTSGRIATSIPDKLLWVAGGVGITPFMSMWDGICDVSRALAQDQSVHTTDIVLVFAGRDDDIGLIRHLLNDQDSKPAAVSLTILVFQSLGDASDKAQVALDRLQQAYPQASLMIKQRRLRASDIATIDNLSQREAFVCGPDQLMHLVTQWLEEIGVDAGKIHQESYNF